MSTNNSYSILAQDLPGRIPGKSTGIGRFALFQDVVG